MTTIGKYNQLKVVKFTDFGIYLDGENFGEVLLPLRYVPENCKLDDILDVFIYRDSEDRIIATTEKPYACVGEFAYLKVVAVNTVGAFLDWGLLKDLLVPYREQKITLEEGRSYVVYVYLDEDSQRITASTKLDKFLDNQSTEFTEGEEVDLFICNQTDIGYKAIINGTHWGVLYENEVFQTLKRGQKIKGYIKKIREDKKIDLCLQKPGYEKVDELTEMILAKLKEKGGYIAVTDKSPSEVIYKLFGISKKSFKMTIGALYKKRIISMEGAGIRLIE